MVSRLYLLSTDVIGDRKPTNSRGCLEDHDLREALRGQLIEEWESREALNARLGTDAFGALMGAFDLLGDRDRHCVPHLHRGVRTDRGCEEIAWQPVC
jgi:hypothetical protein